MTPGAQANLQSEDRKLREAGYGVETSAAGLEPGDETLGSRQTVLEVENDGLHIPPGKVRLRLRTRKGVERVVIWNRRTRLRVKRPTVAEARELLRSFGVVV